MERFAVEKVEIDEETTKKDVKRGARNRIGDMRVGMTPLMETRFGDMEGLLVRELERLGVGMESAADA